MVDLNIGANKPVTSAGPAIQVNDGQKPPISSSWAALGNELFRVLWIASVASNIGTMMQDVGASWLMTELAPSPLMVALIQTAGALPVLLLSFAAGALADIVDRRWLLIFSQSWMLAAAAGLGILTVFHLTSNTFLCLRGPPDRCVLLEPGAKPASAGWPRIAAAASPGAAAGPETSRPTTGDEG